MSDLHDSFNTAPTVIMLDASPFRQTTAASVVSSLRDDETLEEMAMEGEVSGDAGDVDNNKEHQSQQPPELNLYNMELTGRQKEYSLLKASFMRIRKGEHPSELALIDGLSGTGKSKLATSIRGPVTLKKHGFFVSGKFDAQQREPYSALVEAFTDLCDLLQYDTDAHEDIAKELKGDISVLSKLIPNLDRVLGGTSGTMNHCEHYQRNKNHMSPQDQTSFTRLKLSCRKFLNTVASRKHPVVLLIDDLQWADKPSVEILKSIVTDRSSKFILVIGTYRSDFNTQSDTTYSPPLQDLLDMVKQDEKYLKCTNIHLGKLDSRQVSSLVAKCTSASSSRNDNVQSLAALVVKRTGGNPFFVMRFLDMLQYDGFFEYTENQGWDWSVDQIQAETIATENVVEILAARIETLEANVQSVLKLAAILGFSFDKDVIRIGYLRQQQDSENSGPIDENAVLDLVDNALKVAEENGLVEITSSGTYRFCHDTILDCLYSMTPPGPVLSSVHLILGRVMQQVCANVNTRASDYTFAIADQFNRAKELIATDEECLDCAQCNLLAAKQSMSQCAFVMAAEYARSGLDTIADIPNKWDAEGSFYSTLVDLHCAAAECMYTIGSVAESNDNLQQVLNNSESLSDLTRARSIQVHSLGTQGRLEEGVNAAFEATRALGVNIPKRPAMRHAIWRTVLTKSLLKNKTDQQLLAGGTALDEDVWSAVEMLGIASHYSSLLMNVPQMTVAINTLLQLCVKWDRIISLPYCLFGILEVAMKNIPGAIRMAELTLKMHEIQNAIVPRYGDLNVLHTFLLHWRAPLRDSLDKLYEAYNTAMEAGAIELAFIASSNWMQLAFACGHPLPELEQCMRYYCKQMDEFDHTGQSYLSVPYWQGCLNLMGQSDDPVVLTGEAMDQGKYLLEAKADMVAVVPQTLCWVRIFMACHFDYLHLLETLMPECEAFGSLNAIHFNVYIAKFFFGLSYIKLYRGFQRRSDKRKAQKIAKELGKWSDDGCPNTRPLFALMQAELATLERKLSKEYIGTLFSDAIEESSVAQNDLWEAMASERAARYYHHLSATDRNNEREARMYMERAIQLYDQYGAYAKIEFLEKTFNNLLNNDHAKQVQPRAIVEETVGVTDN